MLAKRILDRLYSKEGLSGLQIAKRLPCSANKVEYWLHKHKIPKRSISEAIYKKWNPQGDPFFFYKPSNIPEAILYGIGVGLYWGGRHQK